MNPAGTKPPLAGPFGVAQPWEPLPEPYRTRLLRICSTAVADRFDEAAREADALLAELSQKFGPSHIHTLAVGIIRADMAWLSGDLLVTVQNFSLATRAWNSVLGPQHDTTIRSAGNVVAAWHRMNGEDAAAAGPEVVELLDELCIPGSPFMVRLIKQRLRNLRQ